MRRFAAILGALVLFTMSSAAHAAITTWLSGEDNYRVFGSATASGVVAPQTPDEASVFARINTKLPGLKLDNIVGGGYIINSFTTEVGAQENVYGSLYLSPTGGPGSNVLILLSPMMIAPGGEEGRLIYTFDLGTHADYRTWDDSAGGWTAYDAARSGTLADVIGMIDGSPYSSEYAAFFGPQIGMSGTSGTAFNVEEISLQTVPEPATFVIWSLLGGLATAIGWRRRCAA
jgi:hypothetical protein